MAHIDTQRGRAVLTIVQGLAMIKSGALPLWIGALIGHYNFDPRQAGSLVSLYMVGAVLAGFVVASLLGKLNSGLPFAFLGMALASTAFLLLLKLVVYSQMLSLRKFVFVQNELLD